MVAATTNVLYLYCAWTEHKAHSFPQPEKVQFLLSLKILNILEDLSELNCITLTLSHRRVCLWLFALLYKQMQMLYT